MDYDTITTIEDLASFVSAAAHVALAVLGFIAGWQR